MARMGPPVEKKQKLDLADWRHLLIVTLGLFAALVAVGALSNDVGVLGITVVLGMFIIVTPQVLMLYQRYRQVKEMEERFPSFLRDMTESIRSGMPFHKAIIESSKSDYGSLTPEVKKMAHQLTWGVPIDKVLDKFADRVKASKRLYTSAKIIRESFASGGKVVSTLESVADSATNLEEAEKEKKSLLSQYVLLMYAISIIFVVIISAINGFLVPIFQTTGGSPAAGGAIGEIVSLENPCNTAIGLEVPVCDFYTNVIGSWLVVDPDTNMPVNPSDITVYYTSLFFLMSLMQSVLSGLVAGQISEGSLRAGIKHSLILAGITFGAFLILIRLGFLGI